MKKKLNKKYNKYKRNEARIYKNTVFHQGKDTNWKVHAAMLGNQKIDVSRKVGNNTKNTKAYSLVIISLLLTTTTTTKLLFSSFSNEGCTMSNILEVSTKMTDRFKAT